MHMMCRLIEAVYSSINTNTRAQDAPRYMHVTLKVSFAVSLLRNVTSAEMGTDVL